MELLDLLEQADRNSYPERPNGDHGNPDWPITDQSAQCGGNETELFLDSLLSVSECTAGSALLPWALSPCDSGVSDDPAPDSGVSDDPAPDSPRPVVIPHIDPLFFAQHPTLLQSLLPPQLHKHAALPEAGSSPSSLTEPNVPVDVAAWECPLLYGSSPPPCVPEAAQNGEASSLYQLSVRELLLFNLGGPTSSQQLTLNDDEKKLLAKEGVSLPSHLPLTMHEEKILRKVRRKIRNKRSAQESRKKKKQYVDSLEERMASCSAQNLDLQKKVIQLEKNNTSLMKQFWRLQSLLIKASNKPAQTGTCVLVMLLSFSLILTRSFQPVFYSEAADPGCFDVARVPPRTLRSMVEALRVHPAVSADESEEVTDSQSSKMHGRPQYADMDSPPYNSNHRDQGYHHGHPQTRLAATL